MSEQVPEKWNKAERLAVAGALAPNLRANSDRLSRRVVHTWNQQTGEVTRHLTGVEAVEGILRTAEIEFDVRDGARPKNVVCEFCGRVVRVAKSRSIVPLACLPEDGGCHRQQTCAKAGCSRR